MVGQGHDFNGSRIRMDISSLRKSAPMCPDYSACTSATADDQAGIVFLTVTTPLATFTHVATPCMRRRIEAHLLQVDRAADRPRPAREIEGVDRKAFSPAKRAGGSPR